MNQQIEDNLIMGLANVFTAHGWVDTNISFWDKNV